VLTQEEEQALVLEEQGSLHMDHMEEEEEEPYT
jgi:hypothetical protein